MSLEDIKLSRKVMGLNALLLMLTTGFVILIVLYQKGALEKNIYKELDKFAVNETSKIAQDVLLMCRSQQEAIEEKLKYDLNVANEVMATTGSVNFSGETLSWTVTNQFTKESKQVSLPKMMVGNSWLGQNKDVSAPSPIVDKVKKLVGGTCTIFQRMNKDGDMLRVCTNVEKLDGTRAIGTFIPYKNPDGKVNPVVSTVLSGQTFYGRAFVVNDWYITAYNPIWNSQRTQVVGVMYVGVKQESMSSLRNGIMNIAVGKTGYVYVLGGKDTQKGKYIISYKGQRDGENIWEAKDASGNYFIQEIVDKALKTENGSVAIQRYPWKNKGEDKARMKLAAVTYFEPWDWVIGAGAYEEDFQDAKMAVSDNLMSMIAWVIGIGLSVVLLALIFCNLFVNKQITKPLEKLQLSLNAISRGDLSQNIDINREDEIGRFADSFRDMTKALQAKANAAKEIAGGNLDIEVDVASDADTLGYAMINMVKNIREAIADSSQKVDFLNKIPTPVMVVDKEMTVQFMNPAGAGAVGKTPQECMGKKCFELFKTSHCNTAECRVARAMQQNGTFTGDTVANLPSGELPIRYTGAPLKDESGQIIGGLEFVVDISEENQAVKEVTSIVADSLAGKLDTRGDPDKYQIAGFKNVIKGINDTLDAIIEPLNEVSQTLRTAASKDLTRMVEGDYKGQLAELKNNV
ncbi:MAG: Cache 3/Cache 2 fusion domain-containing protein, partial [Syntrophaceae bacterium]|nr:Cache 3/Cache 2 fusion domain-containing protein [Syntrophaceae bacterium]